ncbi:MAG: pitrilysin family protein [Gammaproteobacteria bacterium]
MKHFKPCLALAAAGLVAGCAQTPAPPPETEAAAPSAPGATFTVPVVYETLDNGLKVVLSPDDTAPVATVAVYYHIGFRNEPKDRTGFAHLFEHMMFQGSENLGKMEFIKLVQGLGGSLNGSTRFDFTNYFQTVPAHRVETVLWAEADRMRSLQVTQDNLTNQQGVVKNEVKVNVLNQPYGGFPWLDMPQYANENWYNAHNFYGDLEDLDAATLGEVRSFFDTYYAPNNAVVVVTGDIDTGATLAMVNKYFGNIASPAARPAQPDISEPRQEVEKRFTRVDPLAPRPGLAWAYHVPPRGTPEHYAMVLLASILADGEDSLLHQKLVKEKGYAGGVGAAINMLGNPFNYEGPMLWVGYLIHDPSHSADTIMADVDAVIDGLRSTPVDAETLDRALVKFRSGFYDTLASGFGRADLLASYALFDDNPAGINNIEAGIRAVTPELILQTAREYLRPGNRTVLVLEAGAGQPAATMSQQPGQ